MPGKPIRKAIKRATRKAGAALGNMPRRTPDGGMVMKGRMANMKGKK